MNQRGKVTLLLFFFCVCATSVLLHYAEETRTERLRPVDLYDVVQRQLEACRANNFPTAYGQVASTFQQRCSLDEFSGLVQASCGRIRQAERVEYGAWERRGRHAMVEVFFIAHDGSVYPCIYTFISEGAEWKIDGARWVKDWPANRRMRGLRS